MLNKLEKKSFVAAAGRLLLGGARGIAKKITKGFTDANGITGKAMYTAGTAGTVSAGANSAKNAFSSSERARNVVNSHPIIKQGKTMSLVQLEKESKFKPTKLAAGAAGLYAGIEAFGGAKDKIKKFQDDGKAKRAVAYAKSKHPELRKRSDRDLATWMQGIYAMSPKVATSPALAASALLSIDAYNGNFDLATAKVLADINRGAGANDSGTNSSAHTMNVIKTTHSL
jgi:hypothetical protein